MATVPVIERTACGLNTATHTSRSGGPASRCAATACLDLEGYERVACVAADPPYAARTPLICGSLPRAGLTRPLSGAEVQDLVAPDTLPLGLIGAMLRKQAPFQRRPARTRPVSGSPNRFAGGPH